MKVGRNNVVMGRVPDGLVIGDGNVIIGPTDAAGNVILRQGMAVGSGACAGPNSIAIGAGAGAGAVQPALIRLLVTLESHAPPGDVELRSQIIELIQAIQAGPERSSKIAEIWQGVQAMATFDGASSLLQKISESLRGTFGF